MLQIELSALVFVIGFSSCHVVASNSWIKNFGIFFHSYITKLIVVKYFPKGVFYCKYATEFHYDILT